MIPDKEDNRLLVMKSNLNFFSKIFLLTCARACAEPGACV